MVADAVLDRLVHNAHRLMRRAGLSTRLFAAAGARRGRQAASWGYPVLFPGRWAGRC
jgi:hypothetical protein